MSELTVEQIKRKRIVNLTLSTIALLFLGLIYAFSMFAAPMVATFQLQGSNIGLTFNIMMICFCVGAVIGSFIEKKTSVKVSIILAGVMFLIGFAGTALLATGNIIIVYLFYGIFAGAGVGIGYNSIVATTNVWFPDKVGTSSGILMLGFGISSLVCGTASVNIANAIGLQATFIGLGVITLVITIVLATVLQRPPADIAAKLMPDKKVAASSYDPADEDFPLKTSTFYIYWIWAIIVIGIGLATIGNCSSDAQSTGVSASFAVLLVGLVSTCNGVGRLVIGAIYDRTNVKITMFVDALIALVAVILIAAAMATSQQILYIVGALLCGFCYGGVPVVASAFSRQRYGAKNYPTNLSITNFAIVFGSILNIVIQAATGNVRMVVFIVLIVFAVIAVLDFFPFSKKWNNDMKMFEEKRAAHVE